MEKIEEQKKRQLECKKLSETQGTLLTEIKKAFYNIGSLLMCVGDNKIYNRTSDEPENHNICKDIAETDGEHRLPIVILF